MNRVSILFLLGIGVSWMAQAREPSEGICTAYLKPGFIVSQWKVSAGNCRLYCEQNGFDAEKLRRDCIYESDEAPWSAVPVAPGGAGEPTWRSIADTGGTGLSEHGSAE